MNKVIYLSRGPSGSGKSFEIKKYVPSGNIFSTDDFWGSDYKFDASKLAQAHQWNQQRTEEAMKQNISPIGVDNTNLSWWEIEPYAKMAKKHKYDIKFIESTSPWWNEFKETGDVDKLIYTLKQKNQHNVPEEALKRMLQRWTPTNKLPIQESIMNFKEYFDEAVLTEDPLPPDWDSGVYSDKTSFAKQVKYAMERAAKMGTGSSRVVFNIQFEGRETALKVAKNAKGLAQNQREADYSLYRMYPDITIPLIDYDEVNYPPKWIHFEKAQKLTAAKFKQITGMDFTRFGLALRNSEVSGRGYGVSYTIKPDELEIIEQSELYNDVVDLMGNFDILAGDLTRTANWGLYEGRPVIIDLGFSSDVKKQHYSR